MPEQDGIENQTVSLRYETDPSPISPPIATWGKFRLIAKIGQGGFGEVYRAWDPELRA